MIKFTECLNDTWSYFFLGDPATVSKFQLQNNLSDDLIHEFTTNESGDRITKEGVLIPLAGINNYPYHIYFQINSEESIFKEKENDLQFHNAGYVLEVISSEIYLMTVPYLKSWNEEGGIYRLVSNGIRPRVSLENGFYTLEILGGETIQESGWEPTFEFILKKQKKRIECSVKEPNFMNSIKSRLY